VTKLKMTLSAVPVLDDKLLDVNAPREVFGGGFHDVDNADGRDIVLIERIVGCFWVTPICY
jgi:hypothetical protein